MVVKIHKVNDTQILVNEKLVQKDTEERWVAKIELTQGELQALESFVIAL